jgi:hypothetical protein
MVTDGRLDLRPIVTARYGLEATRDAIAKSTERTDGKILAKSSWEVVAWGGGSGNAARCTRHQLTDSEGR